MIKDLIVKLMEEANEALEKKSRKNENFLFFLLLSFLKKIINSRNTIFFTEEAEHKGWCDTELSTNEQTRKEKTEAVETLHAEIDELEASIAKLTEEITDLTKAVAELDAAVAKATSVREEEKAKNTVTIKDSQDAQTAVAQALSVLKDRSTCTL